MDQQELNNKKVSNDKSIKTRATLPYIRGVSETPSRVFCCHVVATVMQPHMMLQRMLVHHIRTPM